MCRWLVYIGEKILLADILITPQHSLLNQSLPNRALNTPDVKCSDYYNEKEHKKRNHNVCLLLCSCSNWKTNGDGFGVAWYTHIKHLERAHCFKCMLIDRPTLHGQELHTVSLLPLILIMRSHLARLERSEPGLHLRGHRVGRRVCPCARLVWLAHQPAELPPFQVGQVWLSLIASDQELRSMNIACILTFQVYIYAQRCNI